MDIEIRNLDSCPYSSRNGSYGGAAGDKDGIILNDENWIVKYPKSNVGMSKISKFAKFSCGPLSELSEATFMRFLGMMSMRQFLESEKVFWLSPVKTFAGAKRVFTKYARSKTFIFQSLKNDLILNFMKPVMIA